MAVEAPSARELILNAAVRVLREEGPSKLSQTRVAKEAGLRQGHLTYYFPKKSDLWVAAAAHAEELLQRDLGNFLMSDGWPGADATERTRVLALVSYLVKDRQRTKLLVSLALQSDEDPELCAIFLASLQRTRELITLAFGTADSAVTVEILLVAFWGIGIRHMLYGEREDLPSTESLVSKLFDLLAKDEGK